MNTSEFSEFLKTLLDDVHSRAVEQYSKAETVRDGTIVGLAARSEKPTLPNWQQTSSTKERTTPKPSSCVYLTEQKHHGSNGFTCTPGAKEARTRRSTNSAEKLVIGPVQTLSPGNMEWGRCNTVPDKPRRRAWTPRMSLTDMLRNMDMVHNNRWVINPSTKIMQYWLGVNVVAMAFVALISPIQVALLETQLNNLDAMFVMNIIIDFVFFVDMILQFFLMYPVKTEYGTRLEQKHRRIAQHYLRTWFLIDLISILPVEYLSLALKKKKVFVNATIVKTVRLLRLLKMLRMLKVSRIYQRLEMSFVQLHSYQVFDLYKFMVCLVLISHWLACLWAMTLSLGDKNWARWVDTFDAEEKTKDSVWKVYVAALYFTAYTMTSVGYGDVTPMNIVERIVCILILFISGLVWACVIGEVTSIFGSLHAHEQDFRSLMDNLNQMMRDRELPWPVRKRLRTFFLSARKAQRTEQQEQILRRMSPVLQGEVALLSNWHWVKKVSFINKLVPEVRSSDVTRAPHFVVDIALALGSAVFAQSEVFGEPRVLYILRQGLALSQARSLIKVFRTGDVWGEDFLLSNCSLRESERRLAMTFVEIHQLTLDNFQKVLETHGSNLVLRKRLRHFVVRLAARRAIVQEARRRRDAVADEQMPTIDWQDSTLQDSTEELFTLEL